MVECPLPQWSIAVWSGKVVMLPATEDIPTFAVQIASEDIQMQCCQHHAEPFPIYLSGLLGRWERHTV